MAKDGAIARNRRRFQVLRTEGQGKEEELLAGWVRRIDYLEALIAKMDSEAPLADETCDDPGIRFSVACSRELQDEGHPLFQNVYKEKQ